MNKAIMIGAGQIGRGFIDMELEKAGYHVLFADINQAVIDDINLRGEYTVHMVDTECIDTVVKNISAISSLAPEFPASFADETVSCLHQRGANCLGKGGTHHCKGHPPAYAGMC